MGVEFPKVGIKGVSQKEAMAILAERRKQLKKKPASKTSIKRKREFIQMLAEHGMTLEDLIDTHAEEIKRQKAMVESSKTTVKQKRQSVENILKLKQTLEEANEAASGSSKEEIARQIEEVNNILLSLEEIGRKQIGEERLKFLDEEEKAMKKLAKLKRPEALIGIPPAFLEKIFREELEEREKAAGEMKMELKMRMEELKKLKKDASALKKRSAWQTRKKRGKK